MKKYEKTQAKINKVLLVLVITAFIYTSFGIEFSELSWETNQQTYKLLFIYLALFTGMGLDHWYEKRKQQQQ
jgi:hypothetical protein